MLEELWSVREEVRRKAPLICSITNNVVTNFTANVLLATGASPIMSEGPSEAEELVKITDALVLNIGTLHPRQIEYFKVAAGYANTYKKPLLLDPVGVGATQYRNETALMLIEKCKISLIRGNYGEIGFLAGSAGGTKGVDSVNSALDQNTTKVMALKTGAIICATGAKDYLSDGKRICINQTGHELLQLVTGTGCALTSLMGAFIAVCEDKILGALSALAFYGAAAEKAAKLTKGPGSFSVNFIDSLYNLKYDEFKEISNGRIKF